jgi:alpha-mannosidase
VTHVHALENEHLRLAFDGESGWLTSLYDKDNEVEFLRDADNAGGVPLVIDDPSDTWSHDVLSFDRVIGRCEAAGGAILLERGPVRQTARVHCRWGSSTVTLDYTLYTGDRRIYLTVTVDWQEQLKMLKLAFPLNLSGAQSTASIPYGSIQRTDDGGEEPCQSWVDVTGTVDGKTVGLGLLNDCKYGYDVLDGELRMSILRSPVYAFHKPRQIEPGVTYHYTDQGVQVVHMALVPHAGTYVNGDVARLAESLNVPPIVSETGAHAGAWPAAASFVSCSAPNVILTVVKMAEDGDDLVLRGYESAGQETVAELGLGLGDNRARWSITWQPHEIKTLRLAAGAGAPVEVDMLEMV